MRRLALSATAFVALVAPQLAIAMGNPGDPADQALTSPTAIAGVVAAATVIVFAGVLVAWRAERAARQLRR